MTTPETVGQFADAVRAAVDAERERWRDALFPGNADTDMGREVMEKGAQWAADVLDEAKTFLMDGERERIKAIVREEQEIARRDSAMFGVFAMAGGFLSILRRIEEGR